MRGNLYSDGSLSKSKAQFSKSPIEHCLIFIPFSQFQSPPRSVSDVAQIKTILTGHVANFVSLSYFSTPLHSTLLYSARLCNLPLSLLYSYSYSFYYPFYSETLRPYWERSFMFGLERDQIPDKGEALWVGYCDVWDGKVGKGERGKRKEKCEESRNQRR